MLFVVWQECYLVQKFVPVIPEVLFQNRWRCRSLPNPWPLNRDGWVIDKQCCLCVDTRVFMTIAIDLVLEGIQETVRFLVETRAKIFPTGERFWYFTTKPHVEQFILKLKEAGIGFFICYHLVKSFSEPLEIILCSVWSTNTGGVFSKFWLN